MRILVTGRTGQIGKRLLQTLAPLGDVVGTSRAEFDLDETSRLGSALDRLAPDLIVNAAAYTAVDQAQREPALAHRINADAPGAIARWAATRDIPMIHFSSDYVFDGSGRTPWTETAPTAPLNVYGLSKRAGEAQIFTAGGPHLVIRTSWIYAEDGRNFLRMILRLASTQDDLRIVDDQIGAPTSAAFVAQATAEIIAQGRDGLNAFLRGRGGLLHLACAGETSWHGFALAIVAGARRRGIALQAKSIVPISTAEFGAPAPRPANSRLDLTRLRQRFGLTPPNWPDELDRMLDALSAG